MATSRFHCTIARTAGFAPKPKALIEKLRFQIGTFCELPSEMRDHRHEERSSDWHLYKKLDTHIEKCA